ncbi:hyalin-like [Anneissia japonica]|uniref:hyalin-like n=1 Tax=Anneissia japonica TaxID=1529436 RepID=UPI0014256AC6|nr:hyalin-like [Anneissia japonica]
MIYLNTLDCRKEWICVEGSSGLSTTVITTGNETSTCVSVYVGETVNISATCSNGYVANKTVIPTTIGSCSESDCDEVLFVIGCKLSSTESATTVPDTTPEQPNTITTDSVISTGPTTAILQLMFETCPQDFVRTTGTGLDYAIIEWNEPIVIGGGGMVDVRKTHDSGAQFSIGTHQVNYTANDEIGQQAYCTFQVQINDNEAPRITCPDDISKMLENGSVSIAVNWNNATAFDNAGSVHVTPFISNTYSSGDLFEEGSYTLMYTATDDVGLTAVCSFTILISGSVCRPGYRECPQKCIQDSYFCDHIPDCIDAFDESEHNCAPCSPSEYRCPNSSKCIPESFLCDTYPYDCLDNADEDYDFCSSKFDSITFVIL